MLEPPFAQRQSKQTLDIKSEYQTQPVSDKRLWLAIRTQGGSVEIYSLDIQLVPKWSSDYDVHQVVK